MPSALRLLRLWRGTNTSLLEVHRDFVSAGGGSALDLQVCSSCWLRGGVFNFSQRGVFFCFIAPIGFHVVADQRLFSTIKS